MTAQRLLVTCLIALTCLLALAGCTVTDDGATPTDDILPPTATATAILTPTPAVTPEATRSLALEAILAPGPTVDAPRRFFVLSGQLWQMSQSGDARKLTSDLQPGAWAQMLDGSRAAVVALRDAEGTRTQEIQLFDTTGPLGDPLYGPVPVAGPDDDKAIVALDWSWDGSRLVAAFADGSLAILPVPEDTTKVPVSLEPVQTPAEPHAIRQVAWSPTGSGVVYIARMSDGTDRLFVTPLGDPAMPVVADRQVSSFAWLPGRGRIAFVEASGGPASRVPGSLFTITPDGASMELLLSAGQFAPAAMMTALNASPDGRTLAFAVYIPGPDGSPVFHSLQTMNIDGGELTAVRVEPGYRVTALWWTAAGLVWRGDGIESKGTPEASESGSGPFILGRFDLASGVTAIIYHSPVATQ